MSLNINRRQIIALASLGTLGLTAYSYRRGIRIPPLMWEPFEPILNTITKNNIRISSLDVIQTKTIMVEGVDVAFRAFNANPCIAFLSNKKTSLRLSLNNISTDAQLQHTDNSKVQINEKISGITRIVEIHFSENEELTLNWHLPSVSEYSFASIGDTGGSKELEWVIQRAHDLGAKFLLHLGDFNYQGSDYESAIKLFNHAPIPCYVSIGNHDFHDQGPQYQHFLDNIGPLNYTFAIGRTRFVNIDTASNTLPYSAGNRGQLLNKVIADNTQYSATIAFTHRPLYDPLEGSDHHIGSIGERDWLVSMLKQSNVTALLSGHLHIIDRRDFAGIDNIIVGQGLGHQDLITNSDYSKIAIGNVNASGEVEFSFAPLSMPFEYHCHPRSNVVKQSLINSKQAEKLQRIEETCNQPQPL